MQRLWAGMKSGLAGRCPECGRGRLFHRYLKVNQQCDQCGLALGEFRSDDAPPYFTIFIVGHLVVPAMFAVEKAFFPPIWVHMSIWGVVTLALTLGMLPLVKGAVIGAQWALRIRG